MNITITGSSGFLGKAVVAQFADTGHSLKCLDSTTDLRKHKTCIEILEGSDVVVHLAAKVGGIGANQKYPATFFYDNALMGVNVIDSCHKLNIPRLIMCGTVCSYPKYTPTPFLEKNFWKGYPEETNAAYGISKKMHLEMCNACNKQYGLNFMYLVPTNLFGKNDNFDPESSHVIPAAIRKFDLALKSGRTPVFWGTGTATREFLNVNDAAKAFVLAATSSYVGGPVNVGSGESFTIKKVVEQIGGMMGYKGPIEWDKTKPNGQPHRHLSTKLCEKVLGFKAETPFEQGLKEAISDYRERYADS